MLAPKSYWPWAVSWPRDHSIFYQVAHAYLDASLPMVAWTLGVLGWLTVGTTVSELNESTNYLRGAEDCYQDRFENVPFGSIGGPWMRGNPERPEYIAEGCWGDYLAGYSSAARALYGEDWATCKFGWVPVIGFR